MKVPHYLFVIVKLSCCSSGILLFILSLYLYVFLNINYFIFIILFNFIYYFLFISLPLYLYIYFILFYTKKKDRLVQIWLIFLYKTKLMLLSEQQVKLISFPVSGSGYLQLITGRLTHNHQTYGVV